MKFVSFVRAGRQGFGAVAGGGVVDLTGRPDPSIVTLKSAIARGFLEPLRDFAKDRPADLPLSGLCLLPVLPDPDKILCVGLNYEKHRAETRRPESSFPTLFTRFADTQVGHGHPLVKPAASDRFDYEGELAVVIGRGGTRIPEDAALTHVAGYSCYNDASVRDWQYHTSQFTPGKNFPATGGFGPYMVTPDEVGDYTGLRLQTRLNGKVMQDAGLDELIFPLPQLISYISQFTPLSAGDVIVTGTPGGVGDKRQPPVHLKHGDVVEVDLGKVGTLTNPVVTENS